MNNDHFESDMKAGVSTVAQQVAELLAQGKPVWLYIVGVPGAWGRRVVKVEDGCLCTTGSKLFTPASPTPLCVQYIPGEDMYVVRRGAPLVYTYTTPLRSEVARFAEVMELMLREHDRKPHWTYMPQTYLLTRLCDEVQELIAAAAAPEPRLEDIAAEAIDVANFAMMIYDNVMGWPGTEYPASGAPDTPDGPPIVEGEAAAE